MDVIPFFLVSAEERSLIFAVGYEFVRDGDVEEAVTFRRQPGSDQTMFGVHASAESACRRLSAVTPLALEWRNVPSSQASTRSLGRIRNTCNRKL